MISFDVKNLFTNVPLDTTIKIILRNIYQERMLGTNIPLKKMEKLLFYAQNMFSLAIAGE